MADDTAPSIGADHKRYDVALIDVAGQRGGYVSFGAGEAVDFVFFLDHDVAVAFEDTAGAAIAPEESAKASADCATVRGRHVVPLEVGTVFLELGPTAEPSVSIVVEEAAGHAHE